MIRSKVMVGPPKVNPANNPRGRPWFLVRWAVCDPMSVMGTGMWHPPCRSARGGPEKSPDRDRLLANRDRNPDLDRGRLRLAALQRWKKAPFPERIEERPIERGVGRGLYQLDLRGAVGGDVKACDRHQVDGAAAQLLGNFRQGLIERAGAHVAAAGRGPCDGWRRRRAGRGRRRGRRRRGRGRDPLWTRLMRWRGRRFD